jgi:hypothetical protein
LIHNLNANLVHKWIRVHAQKNLVLQTAFIPVKAFGFITAHSMSACIVSLWSYRIHIYLKYQGTYLENRTLTSFEQLRSVLRDIALDDGYFFRGERRSDYSLKPKIARLVAQPVPSEALLSIVSTRPSRFERYSFWMGVQCG